MSFNIAIDGPAGAGKSTIAKLVAKKLQYIYVDTGAMYRAMAVYMLNQKVDPNDSEVVANCCVHAMIEIVYKDGQQCVILNGEDVTGLLRTEEVGNAASVVSAVPQVRAHLLDLQKGLAAKYDVIMDGRDIGTCVLPGADVKIFLTADSGVRAKRRCLELKAKGIDADVEKIKADIEERDYRDMHRDTAPLKQAEDAILVDSSYMTIEEVADRIEAIVKTAQKSAE